MEWKNGSNICVDGSDQKDGSAIPAYITGRVLDSITGNPIKKAKVEVWLADNN